VKLRWLWVAAVLGVVFLFGGIGSAAFVQHTSTVDFCISCHEMRDTVYEEYKTTVHYNNTFGVRAACADCHVPHNWLDTAIRKVMAAKDVYHHLAGTIDTKEKFEANRLAMAERVWARMKENNSRECRNCHSFEAMVPENQKPRARKQHENALADGGTCIDCHKGIAHKPIHDKAKQDGGDTQDFSLQF
jgi:nitrate/TMAO reductase-like tetraheme cytochrome c subunit